MAKICPAVEITRDDIDSNGFYTGNLDLSDTDLSIILAPGLGYVRFQTIQTSGSIQIYRKTILKIDGDLRAEGGIFALGDLTVAGNLHGGLGILSDATLFADGSIRCGGDVKVAQNLVANGEIYSFGSIRAGWKIHSGATIKAALGSVTAGDTITSYGAMSANRDISGKEVFCSDTIRAGGYIRASDIVRAKSIYANSGIYAGIVDGEESVTTDGAIEVGGDITAAGDVKAGQHIKARRIIAARISAGTNPEAASLPGYNEVCSNIVHGTLANGQHVPA